jgi:hypothetical protein
MKNAGTLDRIVRIALGTSLLSLAFVGPESPFGYIGAIPLLTGLVGFCPLYRIVGLNTCPAPRP